MRISKDVYLDACMDEIKRLLGQLDKNKGSPTYGCFDRLYWNFRVRDFPGTIPQYATLTLALLYITKSKKNKWYKDSLIKEYATAAMLFWAKMQNKNGSFNEAYPNDNSQPVTGFSLYFVGEAYRILREELTDDTKRIMNNAMDRAAEFIWVGSESFKAKRGDPEVPNHDAGCVNALYLMYLLTKKEKYKTMSQIMFKDLLKLQTGEGWFEEYGGADVGYSTFMHFWLANYYRMSRNKGAKTAIDKLTEFLSYFIHPDSSLGGEYGSRTTYFYIPAGFEMASWNSKAASIAEFMLQGIKNKTVLVPESFDDSNLQSFPFFTFLIAHNNHKRGRKIVKLPCQEKEMLALYKKSKLFVIKTKNYYAIVNGDKGVIKIFKTNKPKLIFSDTGWISTGKNKIASGIYTTGSKIEVSKDKKSLRVKTNFGKVKFQYASPFRTAVSRAIFPVASNFPFLKKILKALLRRMVITGQKKVSTTLIREIHFNEKAITIKDKIFGGKGKSFLSTGNFTSLWSYPGGLYRKREDLEHVQKKWEKDFVSKIKF